MTRMGTWWADGPPRGGRLAETSAGLVDLPTGLPARLTCDVVRTEDVPRLVRAGGWQDETQASADGPETCIDGWLTQDWLGRWQQRRVLVRPPAGTGLRAGCAPPVTPLARHGHIGVTLAESVGEWLAIASHGRADGLVPVHSSLLTYVNAWAPSRWPALMLGVPCREDARPALDDVHSTLTRHGGRVAMLVRLPDDGRVDGCVTGRAEGVRHALPPLRPPRMAAMARHVRRACRELSRAKKWPSIAWIPSPAGGPTAMTHLELLDVSTQIEDVRRNEDALLVACRAAREHTRADCTAVVVARGAESSIVASDGPPGDSPLAWRQLCRVDGPRDLVSTGGWHTAARHDRDDGGTVWVCGRWPSREQGTGVCELLSVFARLVAPRVPMPAMRPAGPPGLAETLVGDSIVMQDVRAQIALAARAPFPVLVRGESGCGKELAARAIHALGPRRHRRCAAINCAALPDDLIESELFGHVRGAFTGASTDRAGLFDDADGGTLFLDEVGELGARAQAKLLRVLQDGEVRRVGENHARRVDVRVIAATNVSLEDAVRRGTFRADLFYRLDVVRVRMPALRERRDDIPLLARHFWHECTARVGSRARLEGRALETLAHYDWPGNVRQLQNTLAALAVRVPPKGRVSVDDLPPEVRRPDRDGGHAARGGLDAARREFEATYVRDALTRAGGRPSMAARDLGLTRQGLSKLVRRLGLDGDAPGSRLP